MFRIYFINFQCYSQRESETIEGAKQIAKDACFEARIEDSAGNVYGFFSPISGFNMDRPSIDMAHEWVGENCDDLTGSAYDRKVSEVAGEIASDITE